MIRCRKERRLPDILPLPLYLMPESVLCYARARYYLRALMPFEYAPCARDAVMMRRLCFVRSVDALRRSATYLYERHGYV